MDEDLVVDAVPPAVPPGPGRTGPAAPRGRSLWWWVAVAGIVVAAGGAVYLMSKRGKKARRKVGQAWKKVRGGLAVAAISGFLNRAGQKAGERVL